MEMVKNLENPNEIQENSFNQELEWLEKDIKANHSEDDSKWRERSSVPREMRSVLLKYEGKSNLSDAEFKTYIGYINKYKTHADFRNLTKITDYQAIEIAKISKGWLDLRKLTSITDKQAELFSKVDYLTLNWLTSITDKQAEILSKVTNRVELNWLTSITDKQTESLSKVKEVYLCWLKNITDKQVEVLSKVEWLKLNWLTSITDKQAELLSNVEYLGINKDIVTPKQKKIILEKERYLIDPSRDGSDWYYGRGNVIR